MFTDIQGCSERITASVFILSAVNPESKGFNVAAFKTLNIHVYIKNKCD